MIPWSGLVRAACRLWLAGTATLAMAAADPAPPPAAGAATAAATPSLTEILHRTEIADRLADEVRQDLRVGQDLLGQESGLAEAAPSLRWSLDDPAGSDPAETQVMRLFDLETLIDADTERLTGLAERLSEQTIRLEAALERLQEEVQRWTRFQESARSRAAPPELLTRIGALATTLEDLRRQVLPQRNALLLLLDRTLQQRSRMTALHAQLLTRRTAMQERMRSAAAKPLWRIAFDPDRERRNLAAAGAAGTLRLAATRAYWQEHWPVLIGLFTLPFLAMLTLFKRALPRLADPLAADPCQRPALSVLQAPTWGALLVALVGLDWLAPPAPIAFYNLLWLAMPLPGLMLARAVWGPGLTARLAALVMALLPLPLSTLLELMPWAERWTLMAQGTLVTIALAWQLAADRRSPDPVRFGPLVNAGLGLSIAGLTLGLAANLLGYVGLSRLLIQGVLGALGFALIYSLGERVLFSLGVVLLHSRWAAYSHILRAHCGPAARLLRRALTVTFALMWVFTVLVIFRVFDPLYAAGLRLLNFTFVLGGTTIAVKAGVTALLLLVGAYALIRAVRLLLEEELFVRVPLPPGLPFAISAIVRYTIAVLAVVLAALALGIDLGRVGLLVGALGVGIGFGLQNIFNNFVSGLILLLEQPVHIGDVIEVAQLNGTVKRIGIRSSTIRTYQGAEIVVPNAELISRDVVNWTLSDRRRRLEIDIGVDGSTEADVVIGLLESAARDVPAVLPDPTPFALLAGFGDSAHLFRLYAWIEHYEDNLQIASDLRRAIAARLRANAPGPARPP